MWKKLKHDEENTSKLRMTDKRYAAPLADMSVMTQGNFRSGLRYIFPYDKQKMLMFTPEEFWNISVKVEAFVKLQMDVRFRKFGAQLCDCLLISSQTVRAHIFPTFF